MKSSEHPIKEEWDTYYRTLEAIRQLGITNMFGAATYLVKYCNIDKKLATEVLSSWIANYDELSEKFSWR